MSRPVEAERLKRIESLLSLALARHGGGAGGTTSSFVFQPGGTAGQNVFVTWPSLVAAVNAVVGIKFVLIDPTHGVCEVPAGTWNLNNWWIVGGGPSFALTFLNGAHIDPLTESLYFENLTIVDAGSTPILTLTPANFPEIQFHFCAIENTGGSTFLTAPVGTGAVILAADNTILGLLGTTIFQFDDTTGPPFLSAITLVGGSSLAANATEGAGNVQVNRGVDCEVVSPQLAGINVQTLFLQTSEGDNAAIVPVDTVATQLCQLTLGLQPFQSVDIWAEANFAPLAGTANLVTLQIFDGATPLGVAVHDHTTTTGSCQVAMARIGQSFAVGSHTFTLQATASGGTTGCQVGAHLAKLQARVYG